MLSCRLCCGHACFPCCCCRVTIWFHWGRWCCCCVGSAVALKVVWCHQCQIPQMVWTARLNTPFCTLRVLRPCRRRGGVSVCRGGQACLACVPGRGLGVPLGKNPAALQTPSRHLSLFISTSQAGLFPGGTLLVPCMIQLWLSSSLSYAPYMHG